MIPRSQCPCQATVPEARGRYHLLRYQQARDPVETAGHLSVPNQAARVAGSSPHTLRGARTEPAAQFPHPHLCSPHLNGHPLSSALQTLAAGPLQQALPVALFFEQPGALDTVSPWHWSCQFWFGLHSPRSRSSQRLHL